MLKDGGAGGGDWVRPCDSCRSAACAVYCRADSAYLCVCCDARVHAANRVALRHERVWVCEACESAPAAFSCKADAAALCAACDADIHAANPLARRHHRVPILPLASPIDINIAGDEEEDYAAAAAPWMLPNPSKSNNDIYQGGVDEYLDLVDYNSTEEQCNNDDSSTHVKAEESDRVVPVQSFPGNENPPHDFHLEMEFEASKTTYGYPASINHTVPMEAAGIVPDAAMKQTGPAAATQFSAMDREARVLRYREKRKTRKFEKTIRYASRKAYAETRPRIKGRFAKRSAVQVEVEQMFSSSGYGVVPSYC